MTTETDEIAFRAAIAANPDDDTPRLVFADWLDENPLPDVKCPHCKGKGWYSYNGAEFGYTVENCTDCGGNDEKKGCGTICDTSNRDRAGRKIC